MSAQPPQPTPEQLEAAAAGQGMTLLLAMLDTAKMVVSKARITDSAAEAKDYAQASLFLAQAIVMLDPSRIENGDDPEAKKKASTPAPPTRDTDGDGKTGES